MSTSIRQQKNQRVGLGLVVTSLWRMRLGAAKPYANVTVFTSQESIRDLNPNISIFEHFAHLPRARTSAKTLSLLNKLNGFACVRVIFT